MNHDRLFKELLTTFFAEFVELFLPHIAADLDHGSIQFIDKEVFTDIGSGDRHEVDLLAKVKLRGREAFILIHVENQSSWQPDFPQRMFRYFALIHGKYGLPVYPIALFSFDRPVVRASDVYALQLFDLPVLRFQFQAIQLNMLNWREFLDKPNPVASALMVKMRIEPQDRPRVKLECLRMLATLKLDPARTRLIGVFMNSYLRLTSEETNVYNQRMQELPTKERETAWSVDNALAEVARSQMVMHLLERRFGEAPTELHNDLDRLTSSQIEDLLLAMFDFNTIDDAKAWIAKTAS